ncbi:hypothetical protein, partial [Aeromonas sanarellii]
PAGLTPRRNSPPTYVGGSPLSHLRWYAGVVPDEQREMTFKKLMYPINAITEHFNYVTNVARRQGQPYSAELFLTLLSEQATMRDFIMHHFSDEDTKLFATTVKSIAGIV